MGWIKDLFKHNVKAEKRSQDEQWGIQNHENWKWFIILVEEIGEVAKAILEGKHDQLLLELVQCVAVIEQWIESMDRRWENETKNSDDDTENGS